jgi:iron complex outermembrane receptor protein
MFSRFTLLSAFVTVAASVLAQDTPQPSQRIRKPILEEGIETLPEVVVTDTAETSYIATQATETTRMSAPILDTPRSVQVVTQQVIKDRKIVDPQEAVQNVSGVQRGAARSGSGETYIIRGFRQQSLIKDGFRVGESSGSSLFTFSGPTDVANIHQVEILKGPSAILFGRGEPGGTVNYVTNQALFENKFSLEQQVGNDEFYRTQASANWDAIPGRLSVRIDGAYQNNESFIDFVEGERSFFAPAFKLQIAPDTTLTFRGEYSNDHQSTSTGVPYADGRVIPGVPYNRYFGEPGITEFQTDAIRGLLQLDHKWNESHRTVASVHGAKSSTDGKNFILFNFAGPLQDPVTGDIARSLEDIDFANEFFTARVDHTWDWTIYEGTDLPVTGKDDKKAITLGRAYPTVKNQLLISGEYERQTTNGYRVLSGHAPLNPYRPHYTGYAPIPLIPGFPLTFEDKRNTDAQAISLLLLDRLSVGDFFHLTFGGRIEWFDANSRFAYSDTTPFGGSNNDFTEQTFNPTFGVVVKPARNVSIYGSYAESTYSFKNIDSVTITGEALDPERARQFEVGVKAEFFDSKLSTSLAVFQIDKENIAAADPTNPFFSINAGEEQSRGVEFDIAGEPIPGWRVIANYAYINARIADDPSGFNLDHRLPGVPEHSGGIFTTYEIQTGALKGLGFGGGAFFSDRVEVDVDNTGNLSGWAQTDAVIYYKRDRFQVQLNVKNLFDNEFYYANNGGGNEVTRANARTIIASARFEF